jgi:hypothetical protein
MAESLGLNSLPEMKTGQLRQKLISHISAELENLKLLDLNTAQLEGLDQDLAAFTSQSSASATDSNRSLLSNRDHKLPASIGTSGSSSLLHDTTARSLDLDETLLGKCNFD